MAAPCWNCSAELCPDDAAYCSTCGHSQSDRTSGALFVVDPVTGLFNHKFVDALVGQEANRAVRYHRPLSVVVVELDHAEHIHNALGKTQIDGLLREIAEALGRATRDTDTVSFLDAQGPPHFAIVLPETDEAGATLAADKIRKSIASHDFAAGGEWQRITVSCGAATISVKPAPEQEAGVMIRREYNGNLLNEAYAALQEGRHSGTNRTTVAALRP